MTHPDEQNIKICDECDGVGRTCTWLREDNFAIGVHKKCPACAGKGYRIEAQP